FPSESASLNHKNHTKSWPRRMYATAHTLITWSHVGVACKDTATLLSQILPESPSPAQCRCTITSHILDYQIPHLRDSAALSTRIHLRLLASEVQHDRECSDRVRWNVPMVHLRRCSRCHHCVVKVMALLQAESALSYRASASHV